MKGLQRRPVWQFSLSVSAFPTHHPTSETTSLRNQALASGLFLSLGPTLETEVTLWACPGKMILVTLTQGVKEYGLKR